MEIFRAHKVEQTKQQLITALSLVLKTVRIWLMRRHKRPSEVFQKSSCCANSDFKNVCKIMSAKQ
jgi:hypothetical protein